MPKESSVQEAKKLAAIMIQDPAIRLVDLDISANQIELYVTHYDGTMRKFIWSE